MADKSPADEVGPLDPERLGEARQLIVSGVVRDRASRRSDVLRSGLRFRLRPLRADLFRRQLAVIDFIHPAKYRLGILLTNFRNRNAADFHGVLKNWRVEVRELIEIRSL